MDGYRKVLRLIEWYDNLPLVEAYKMAGVHETPPELRSKEEEVQYLTELITIS